MRRLQGSDEWLIADLRIRRQPFLKEFDLGLVDGSIRGQAARKSDEFVDLTR